MSVKNVAVILAGGIGERYGAGQPKQYTLLNGKEVISYTIDTCRNLSAIDKFIVVLDEKQYNGGEIQKKYDLEVVLGGSTRNHSFRNAVDYVKEHYGECEKIVFLEAARPLTQSKWLQDYLELLNEYDYVETCLKIVDAMGGIKERIPCREDYYLIQSPEAYRFPMLEACFSGEANIQHAAQQMPESAKGYRYFIPRSNFKVTVPQDALLIEYLLKNEVE